jgi:hypothetical protein
MHHLFWEVYVSISATPVTLPVSREFNYGCEAELFPTRAHKRRRHPFGYKRFARAADAIRFAIEELPPELLGGTFLEVDEERFDATEIRRLYDAPKYPLPRSPSITLNRP